MLKLLEGVVFLVWKLQDIDIGSVMRENRALGLSMDRERGNNNF